MTTPSAPAPPAALEALAAARSRIAVGLTAAMTAVYVAFILLIAFGKSWLGTILAPGLSVGIALGVRGHDRGLLRRRPLGHRRPERAGAGRDYMSAASFLGIAGLVARSGSDGRGRGGLTRRAGG